MSVSIADKITPEYLEEVNRILASGVSPVLAYSLGVLSAMAWESGLAPDRALLAAATDIVCFSPEERPANLLRVFDLWKRLTLHRMLRS